MAFDAPNQTRIVNAALAELGSVEKVTSIDDSTSPVARRAAILWPDVLRDLLDEHPWHFAIRRAPLNLSADAPQWGYRHRYQLPADCIRWLPRRESEPGYRKAEREGRSLCTDAAPPFEIRYIAYIDDVSQWPPAFIRAMTLRLAEAMAEGVTQSEGIKDRCEARAERQIKRAKRRNGLESGDTKVARGTRTSAWLGARRRGWHGPRG